MRYRVTEAELSRTFVQWRIASSELCAHVIRQHYLIPAPKTLRAIAADCGLPYHTICNAHKRGLERLYRMSNSLLRFEFCMMPEAASLCAALGWEQLPTP